MHNQEISSPSKPDTKFFYGYVIVLIAFISQLAMFGPRGSFGVFFKPLISEFGWTRALISGAFSASTLMQGFFSIVMGGLNDRFGPRIVMTLCGFLVGIGFMLLSITNSAWHLYLLYAVMIGIGMGGVYVPIMTTIAKWFVKRRSIMSGSVAAGGGMGGLLIPPIVNLLISNYDWRLSYLILGAIILVIIVTASQFLRRDPQQMGYVPYGENKDEKPRLDLYTNGVSFKEATITWQFWMGVTLLFCFGYCLFTINVHLVPHATDLGISAATAANMLATSGGGLLIGGIILGAVADKIGNRQAFSICFILMSVAISGLLLFEEVWPLYICAAILGLGGGGGATLTSPLMAEIFGMKSHGVILGIHSFTYTIGAATGPYLAGYIFDTSGSYQLAFSIAVTFGIIGLILTLTLRPVKQLVT